MRACIRGLLAAGIAAALHAPVSASERPAPSSASAPDRIPARFEGQVEVAEGAAQDSVIVSTATEEVVVVAAQPLAEELRRLEGRTVILHGWIVDEPQTALVMVVTGYELEGERHSRVGR
jgi:hypothetical protein